MKLYVVSVKNLCYNKHEGEQYGKKIKGIFRYISNQSFNAGGCS